MAPARTTIQPNSPHRSRWHRTLALVLLLVLSVAGLVAADGAARAEDGPDLRISEFSSAGPGGASDDFIELVNVGDEPASLEGWTLYRCAGTGSRVYGEQVPTFGDVTLAPGEVYLIAHERSEVAGGADETYSVSLANGGSGVWLADPQDRRVDSVAMYSAPADSECGIDGGVLPNVLDYGRAQTYQRIDTTGVNADDYIAAGRTPGAPNVTTPDDGVQDSDVLVTELTNGGPAGSSDNFVEIANLGDAPVDVGGWSFSRCIGSGLRYRNTVQATVPDGTVLDPGEVFVFAHTSTVVPDDVAVARYGTSLANAGFGAIIEDHSGALRDAVGVYDGIDSPCTQERALPNQLDYGSDQTYQRYRDTRVNADDFLVRPRTIGTHEAPDPADDPEPTPFEFGPVRITELAPAGPAGASDDFFELANAADEPVDLDGWTIHRCQADGRRAIAPQLPPLEGITLAPGETFVAANSSSPLAEVADATYDVSFADDGFGLVVFDAAGEVVDRVGLFRSMAAPSYCTKGRPHPNWLDTAAGHSAQRISAEGDDVVDLVEAPRTPGELPDDLTRPETPADGSLDPVMVDPAARPLPPKLTDPVDGADGVRPPAAELRATVAHTAGDDVEVTVRGAERLDVASSATRAFAGATAEAPPAARVPDHEEAIAGADVPLDSSDAEPLVTEARDGFPYQRFELAVGDLRTETVEVAWSGSSTGTNELQLYAFDHAAGAWQLLDVAGGVVGGEVTLLGRTEVAASVRDGILDVLVQDGPATGEAFSDESREPDRAFKDPVEYDGALGFVTDTQFYAEQREDAFTAINSWLVANQDARRIAYTAHTGDIIQTWLNGTHPEQVARDEFAFASDVMGILEAGGHPYGITPGNHDNKWGRSNDLYNEYFPPSRYQDRPWYGGAWREGDNQNHFDLVDVGGTDLLVLYLGYFAGTEAIEWANEVIADHPDHNVVFATHEYLNPDGTLSTRENYRWTSLGDRYFEEIVLPNENVFLVLAGHHHGVALNVKRDVDGVEGRTVVEMLANYQGFRRDGRRDTGFLRLLQFDLDAKAMAVNTYSPALDEHNADEYDPNERYTDADDEFTVEVDLNDVYNKRVETARLGVQLPTDGAAIGTATAGDGDEVAVHWRGLRGNRTYAWYAEVIGPEGRSTRSKVTTFETVGGPPPGDRGEAGRR